MLGKFSKKELQSEEWFKKAEEDELSTRAVLKEGAPNIACFLSQQMAEKYFKAFLVHSKKWYPKIHPLDALWELCREIDASFDEIKQDAVYITSFYIETRYPGDSPEFTREECQQVFEAALRIKKFVLSKIRSEEAGSGFGLIGLIIAVAAIATLAGAGWYWKKTQPQMPPAQQVNQSDTSDWKTYRNEKYGFEVRYPNDWSFAGGAPIKNPGDDYFSIRYKSQEAYCSEGLGCVYPGVITIEPRKDLTLKQFKERLTSEGKYSIKEFKVFEHPAVKLIPIKLEGVALEQFNRGIAPSEVIFVELNPSTVLQIWVYTFLQDRSSILRTVDTMLSTFKFIPLEK